MFKFKLILTAAAGLFALGLNTSELSAATVSGTCDAGNKFVSLFSVEANDSSNVLCQSGNPDYSGTPTLLFGGDTFSLAYKSAGGVGSSQEKGDNAYSFTSFGAGTWALSAAPTATLKFLVGIKQGTTYAAFLVNAQSGTWFTANSSTASPGTGISHYDLWYTGTTTTTIPLPASGLLLLGGLGGIAALRRRRKVAT